MSASRRAQYANEEHDYRWVETPKDAAWVFGLRYTRKHHGRSGRCAIRRRRMARPELPQLRTRQDEDRHSGFGPIADYRLICEQRKLLESLLVGDVQATYLVNFKLAHRRSVLLGIVLTFS
jgi:hypothetical protein